MRTGIGNLNKTNKENNMYKYKSKNTTSDWNFVENGCLPDTTREVQVLCNAYGFNEKTVSTYFSSFNPSNGWKYITGVIAWKEIDPVTKKIMDDYTKTSFKGEEEDE